jgi:hypothetical protein
MQFSSPRGSYNTTSRSSHRRHRLPAQRHLTEPGCYWKNLQMGSRTRRPHH